MLFICRRERGGEKESLLIAVNWCKGLGLEFDAINENLDPELKIR